MGRFHNQPVAQIHKRSMDPMVCKVHRRLVIRRAQILEVEETLARLRHRGRAPVRTAIKRTATAVHSINRRLVAAELKPTHSVDQTISVRMPEPMQPAINSIVQLVTDHQATNSFFPTIRQRQIDDVNTPRTELKLDFRRRRFLRDSNIKL